MKSELWMTREEVFENYEKYILVTYVINTENMPLAEAAERIAIEGTTGTWVRAEHETDKIRRKHSARPFEIKHFRDETIGEIEIAFPVENFDPHIGGIPAFLNAVAGTIFSLKFVKTVKIADVVFPKNYLKGFCGPKFGVEGIKKLLGIEKRPPLSTSIKPNIGLDSESFANLSYEVALGGVDIVLDDELLVNPECCKIEERVPKVVKALEKASKQTGSNKIYGVNVTTWSDQIVPLAKKAISFGASMIAVDVITAGYCAVRALASNEEISVPIRGYRHMHAAFTRDPFHGIDMRVICKLSRMVGVDIIDTGSFGRLADDVIEVQQYNRNLRRKWADFKAVYPAISGGIHPGSVETNLRLFGLDVIVHASGSIYGHPNGPKDGATAMRSAIEATTNGVSIEVAQKKCKALWAALNKKGKDWDYCPLPESLSELCEFKG